MKLKKIICLLATIILVISSINTHSLGYATNSHNFANTNTVALNDDNEQDDDNSNESEAPSDNAELENNGSDVENTESDENIDENNNEGNNGKDSITGTTNAPSNKDDGNSSESTDNSSTDIDQQNAESNDVTTVEAAPSEIAETQPIQEKIYLINTLNKKNMWANKTVYLTFDDGPSQITEQVLDILKQENIKATFFVIGNDTDKGKNILKRIDEEGHSIGNHTYSHNYSYIYKDVDNFFDDLSKNDEIIYEATGKHPKIIRFPGGSNNSATKTENGKKVMSKIIDRLNKEGYVYFDWNASSGDASPQPASVDDIVNNVLTWVGKNNNAVVLFHDNYTKINTLKALPILIEKLKFLGCNFDTLSKDSYQVSFIKKYCDNNPKTNHRKPSYVTKKLKRLEARYDNYF